MSMKSKYLFEYEANGQADVDISWCEVNQRWEILIGDEDMVLVCVYSKYEPRAGVRSYDGNRRL